MDRTSLPQWDGLSGKEFETIVARLLESRNLIVSERSVGADGGIDMIAVSSDPIMGGNFVIQCKRIQAKVGAPAVRDLLGVVASRKANKGILITTSRFTPAAREFAEDNPIELVDGSQFQTLVDDSDVDASELALASTMTPFETLKSLATLRAHVKRIGSKAKKQDEELSNGLRLIKMKGMTNLKRELDFLDNIFARLTTTTETLDNQVQRLFRGFQCPVTMSEIDRKVKLLESVVGEICSVQRDLHSIQLLKPSEITKQSSPDLKMSLPRMRIWARIAIERLPKDKQFVQIVISSIVKSLVELQKGVEIAEMKCLERGVQEGETIDIPWTIDWSPVHKEEALTVEWMDRRRGEMLEEFKHAE